MKRLALLLGGLLLVIQWPLWFGHGGWLRVWDLQRQLAQREATNADLRARDAQLSAELASLRQGSEAIEERARGELHMIRPEETFFQLLPGTAAAQAAAPPAAPQPPAAVASIQALELGLK